MNPIPETLSAATLGEPLTSLNLAVFPLLRPATDPPTYLILDEALRTGRFRITEVSQGGSVPELLVINELDQAVLIVDGEQWSAPSRTASSTCPC